MSDKNRRRETETLVPGDVPIAERDTRLDREAMDLARRRMVDITVLAPESDVELVTLLGALDAVPYRPARETALSLLDLDPHEAFIFTLIDGTLTFESLTDVSGMPRWRTLRCLASLLARGLVKVDSRSL